jgi:hypothetical protein
LTPVFDEIRRCTDTDFIFLTNCKRFPEIPDAPHIHHEPLITPGGTWLSRVAAKLCRKLETILHYRYQIISGFRGFDIRVQSLKNSTDFQAYSGKDNRKEYQSYITQKRFFGRSKILYRLLTWCLDLLYRITQPEVRAQFERHQPDILVTNEPHSHHLREYYAAARLRGLPTLSMVLSWDNVTLRGALVPTITHFLVWNGVMKEELAEHHGVDKNSITVVGIPHLDISSQLDTTHRADYLKTLGADPARQVILYATTSWRIGRDEPEICRHIAKHVLDDKYARPCTLIIRLHHTEPKERYAEFMKMPHVVVQPAIRLDPVSIVERNFVGDTKDLLRVIQVSDVLINMSSTISLEACFLDTPVINIGFDGETPRPAYESAGFFLRNEHYAKFLEHKGSRPVFTFSELHSAINEYLTNPGCDAEGRASIRAAYLGFNGVSASRRIVASMRTLACHEHSPAPPDIEFSDANNARSP